MNIPVFLSIFILTVLSGKQEEVEYCGKTYLIKSDFTHNNNPIVLEGPNANWSYFATPFGLIANGGKLIPGKHGPRIQVPFTASGPNLPSTIFHASNMPSLTAALFLSYQREKPPFPIK